MSLTIEIDDRDFDVENVTRCLVLPARREYVGRLTVDRGDDAQITYDGDVQLVSLSQADNVLTVAPWIEAVGAAEVDKAFEVNVADIRRIEFY